VFKGVPFHFFGKIVMTIRKCMAVEGSIHQVVPKVTLKMVEKLLIRIPLVI
jgi:hypothetical protein